MGRPLRYTEELAEIICSRLAAGESLNFICSADDFPVPESTVRGWALENVNGFDAKYSRARDMGIDSRMDKMRDRQVALMDSVTKDTPPQLVAAYTQAWRAETWYAAKCAPKRYSDRMELAGDKDAPLSITVRRMDK